MGSARSRSPLPSVGARGKSSRSAAPSLVRVDRGGALDEPCCSPAFTRRLRACSLRSRFKAARRSTSGNLSHMPAAY